MIRGIKFACVPTRDQDRALKFYTEKLGFRVMTDQPFGAQRWIEARRERSLFQQNLLYAPGLAALSRW